jgi:hypothetical protein
MAAAEASLYLRRRIPSGDPMIEARPDPSLAARVVRRVALTYAAGADPSQDRPAHVRSASGIARVGGRIAVVQDDASFVALVDPATGSAEAIALPAGEGGVRQFDDLRGNKRHKLDLESCVAVRDADGAETLLAFGSGSTPARERIVTVRGIGRGEPEVRVVDASAFYRRLRGLTAFSGSELNVEGAAAVGGVLRLFNRGNGAPANGLSPVDATCDVDLAALLAFLATPGSPPPEPRDVTRYALGSVVGVPLTFTDAAGVGDAVLYSAAAEDSPDATRDGPVGGVALGIIDAGGARYAIVRAESGAPYAGKIEGILLVSSGRLLAVIDRDDPLVPSELLEVALDGPWPIAG